MKIIGIIVEYNPFHNGHIKHLNLAQKKSNADLIIAVMSGNFVQRGDLSIINKFDKTKIALEYGVDLVIELPFIHSNQAADYFALEAIKILNFFNVDEIYYGSESGNKFEINLKSPFDKAKNLASNLFSKNMKSNDILANSYQKAISKINPQIKANYILREDDSNTDSATSIRQKFYQDINFSEFVPNSYTKYMNKVNYEKMFELLKYATITNENLDNIAGSDEGIGNRLKDSIYKTSSWEELVNVMKSKKHSQYRVQRFLMNVLINITYDDVKKSREENYLRILGFNGKGQKYLAQIKCEIDYKISLKSCDDITSKIEIKSSNIYAMIMNQDPKMDFNKPVIKWN